MKSSAADLVRLIRDPRVSEKSAIEILETALTLRESGGMLAVMASPKSDPDWNDLVEEDTACT